jgi:hypothetical protein
MGDAVIEQLDVGIATLEEGLLQLYKRAVDERHMDVAEQLLCALEQLAKSDLAGKDAVEEAYLWICCGRHPLDA